MNPFSTAPVLTRRRLLGAALAGAAAVAVPASPAVAAVPRASFSRRYPASIHGYANSLYPEGVIWDPTRDAILVASTRHGTVSIVDGSGNTTPLIGKPDPAMVSTIGMGLDLRRNRLLVAYFDLGEGVNSTPGTFLKVSGVGFFDLATGEQQGLVNLSIGAGQYHAADRMAIDACGNAYICDPAANQIYLVTPAGEASILVDHTVLAPGVQVGLGAGTTGLALHPGGFLLAMNYSEGILVRVPLADPASATPVRLPSPLYGGDGIALHGDGSLIVVSNDLSTSNGVNAVTVLHPTDESWTAATFLQQVQPWPVPAPTAVAVTPYGSYVLSGRANLLNSGVLTANDFVLQRL